MRGFGQGCGLRVAGLEEMTRGEWKKFYSELRKRYTLGDQRVADFYLFAFGDRCGHKRYQWVDSTRYLHFVYPDMRRDGMPF